MIREPPERLRLAQEHLRQADPVIGRFIELRPDFDPHAWLDELPPMDRFGSLLFQVAGQQLSVAATRRTVDRVTALVGGHMPSPGELLAVEPGELRAAGFSWRKVNTLRDLAERFSDGRLDMRRLAQLPDDEFIAELTAVPGIGPWTAQGALLVALRREDVVLPGDLALRKSGAHRLSPRSLAQPGRGPRDRREVAPVSQPRHLPPFRCRLLSRRRPANIVTSDRDPQLHWRWLGPYPVAPIGFGAMQLTGPGVFGPPPDRRDALQLLRDVINAGVNHIDTAQYYGPDVVNELIRVALHPYPTDLVLVSKVGARRDDRGGIFVYDEPAQLRAGIEDNLRTLSVESLPVVNLRLMRRGGPDTFFEDQLGAMMAARDDGLISGIGLSNVTLADLTRGLSLTDIACVQNPYDLANRGSQPILEECTRQRIAFVPFAPLGSGGDSVLGLPHVRQVAERLGCTPAQVALAWALEAAPNVVLIPGTSSRRHFEENVSAARVRLDDDALRMLNPSRIV